MLVCGNNASQDVEFVTEEGGGRSLPRPFFLNWI